MEDKTLEELTASLKNCFDKLDLLKSTIISTVEYDDEFLFTIKDITEMYPCLTYHVNRKVVGDNLSKGMTYDEYGSLFSKQVVEDYSSFLAQKYGTNDLAKIKRAIIDQYKEVIKEKN